MTTVRRKIGDLARESITAGDPVGWFERLAASAAGDARAARDATDAPGTMPWPLVRDEFDAFGQAGLEAIRFEDYLDRETPPVRRFRVHYRRPR